MYSKSVEASEFSVAMIRIDPQLDHAKFLVGFCCYGERLKWLKRSWRNLRKWFDECERMKE